jgi:bifunctional non-homologous end joining protein LigD
MRLGSEPEHGSSLSSTRRKYVIGGYTEQDGARKHFGALLVGLCEEKRLKFAGRAGTGFSEKLLRDLTSGLNKIRVEDCPFFNLPAYW